MKFYANVLLGPAKGLPPCLESICWPGPTTEIENNPSVEIVSFFRPSRRGHLWFRLLNNGTVTDEHWICRHQECADWAEQQADKLCPFDELPDAFYRYLDEESRQVEEMLRQQKPVIPDTHPLYENALHGFSERTPLVPLERIMDVLHMLGEPVS